MSTSQKASRMLVVLTVLQLVRAYDMVQRWGHAAVYISQPPSLLIHGGKTSLQPGSTYSSSPNSADLIRLPLSSNFALDSPPLELLSSSSATETLAPAYAWHSLSSLDKEGKVILLFGGDGGSSTPLPAGTDSAWLYKSTSGSFAQQPSEWGAQPSRLIHHGAASNGDGKVYITGGQRNDGSGRILLDVYAFDGLTSTFSALSLLPTGTSDHMSTLLPNGTLVVLGGVQTEASTGNAALASMSMVYALDQGAQAWRTVSIGGEAPQVRRGAAAFHDGDRRLIIMGGANVGRDQALDDVWRLDLKSPAWSRVDQAEGAPAPRFDFTATPIGNGKVLIFGGYGSAGPVSPDLFLYDIASNTWSTSFEIPTPPSNPSSSTTSSSASGGTGKESSSGSPSSPSDASGPGSGSSGAGEEKPSSADLEGTTAPTANPTLSAADSRTLSTGAQVGLAVGIVSGVSLLAILALLCFRRRRRRHMYQSAMRSEKGQGPGQDGETRGLVPQWSEKSVVGLGLGAVSAGWTRISPQRRNEPYASLQDKDEGALTPAPQRKSTRRIGNGVRLTGPRPPLGGSASAAGLRSAMSPPRRDMLSDEDSRTFRNAGAGARGKKEDGDWTVNKKDQNRSSWAPAGRVLQRSTSASSGTDSGFDSDEESLLPPRIRGGPVPTPMASASIIDPFDDSQSVDIGTIRSNRSYLSQHSTASQRDRTGPGLHQLPSSDPMDFSDLLAVPNRFSYNDKSISSRGSTYISASASDAEEGIVHRAERSMTQYAYEYANAGIISPEPDPNEGQPVRRSESFFKRMTAGGIAGLLGGGLVGGAGGGSSERYAKTGPAGPRAGADVRQWHGDSEKPGLWPVESHDEPSNGRAHGRSPASASTASGGSCQDDKEDMALMPPPSAWSGTGTKESAGQSVSSVATAKSMRDFTLVQRERDASGDTFAAFHRPGSGAGARTSRQTSSSGPGDSEQDPPRAVLQKRNATPDGPFGGTSHSQETSESGVEDIISFTNPNTPALLELPSTPPVPVNAVNPYDVALNHVPVPVYEHPDLGANSSTPPTVVLRHVSEEDLHSARKAGEDVTPKQKQPARAPSPPNGSPLAKAMIQHRRPVRDMVSSINKRSSTRFTATEGAAALLAEGVAGAGQRSGSSSRASVSASASASIPPSSHRFAPKRLQSIKRAKEVEGVMSPGSEYSDSASPAVTSQFFGNERTTGRSEDAKEQVADGHVNRDKDRRKGVKWEVRRKDSLIVANPDRK